MFDTTLQIRYVYALKKKKKLTFDRLCNKVGYSSSNTAYVTQGEKFLRLNHSTQLYLYSAFNNGHGHKTALREYNNNSGSKFIIDEFIPN